MTLTEESSEAPECSRLSAPGGTYRPKPFPTEVHVTRPLRELSMLPQPNRHPCTTSHSEHNKAGLATGTRCFLRVVNAASHEGLVVLTHCFETQGQPARE